MPTQTVQRIALFGTSADPPHQGHRGILTWLGHTFDHVAVWAADNPFKADQSPLPARMEMLKLMIDGLQTLGDVELHPELSHRFTIVTLERARQRWPAAHFSLVIGADLVRQLPKWYRAQDIFKQAHILVFPRPGYSLDESDLSQLRSQGAQVAIANPPQQFDVSSSAVRYLHRRPDDFHNIPPDIQRYIQKHHLYPCLENSKEKLPTP